MNTLSQTASAKTAQFLVLLASALHIRRGHDSLWQGWLSWIWFSLSVIARVLGDLQESRRSSFAQLQRLPHGPRAELALGV
jgi:hypothetical protein